MVLGLGPIGNLYRPISDGQAMATLQAWWDRGSRTFDVAPLYGMGIAERRAGEFFQGRARTDFSISTKVGRPIGLKKPGHQDLPGGSSLYSDTPTGAFSFFAFDRDAVLRSLDESLERLKLDRVDYVHIHDPDENIRQAIDEAFPVLAHLRDQGVIGAIGTGVNRSSVAVALVNECDLDCVMIAGRYTLLDQDALVSLLPLCLSRSIPVLAAGVLNSGFLANPEAGARYQYEPCFDLELIDRASRIKSATERFGLSIKSAALQFPFGHPAVRSIVVGAGSAPHATELLDAAGASIPRAFWDELVELELLPADVPLPESAP